MTVLETTIHPLACVEDGAQIGKGVTVEAFATVKKNVRLDDGVTIKSHAYIDGNTHIGSGTVIYPGASIGTQTQDLKFQGETTYVKIGKNCNIREYVTINSSSEEGSVVSVGDHCHIMAYCHIAHHCSIGNHVIMANAAMLSGHVIVGDHARIGGMTPVHQFVRIGRYAMVGGFSRVPHDVPPFTLGGGIPYKMGGLNLIGLKRHDIPLAVRRDLTKAFKLTYRSSLTLKEAIAELEKEFGDSEAVREWLDFAKSSKRGLICLHGVAASPGDFKEDLLER